jgi:type II secretory pathway component PulJ
MSVVPRWYAEQRRRRRTTHGHIGERGDDRGVTLAELAVTTGIMSVVMAIFTTGIVQLFRAGSKNEMVAVTQAQLNNAFLRLDRDLRYAAGISSPRPDTAGNTVVEYVTTGTGTAAGTSRCTQLSLDTASRTLRRQSWTQQTGARPTGRWAVLASQLDIVQSSFTLAAPTENTAFQRLRVVLLVATNPGGGQTRATTDLTFTALNSRASTDPNTICPEARS